ncbi:hypothetical protein [Methanogenium organophilum]|uniref:Uncharacterized protein n=1 Tax=Methanogenium organophilum TaxID=2199 RepID=A0A9X9S6P6_METOG|nr:hypothetical protein [Methanogenium organophilum]WAI02481.1 hypothetical protein OU421_06295 [Methanogenium organophilum]
MTHRVFILFLMMIVLVLPAGAAGDRNDLNYHADADNVPVIYITDTGEYTSSLTFIPLIKAQPYVRAEDHDEWDGDDVITLIALDSDDLRYLYANEALFAYDGSDGDRGAFIIKNEENGYEALVSGGSGGGSGYPEDVRGSEMEVCCAETKQKEVYLPDLLQGVLFSVTDLWMSFNNPPYYLVDLGQKPVEPMDFSPANNFVSSGSTDHHFQLYVPREKRHLWVDLTWAGPETGYQLTIYPPDSVIGPFEDAADGEINQRIYLDISASPQLTPGMWYYTVTNLNGGNSNFNFTNYY